MTPQEAIEFLQETQVGCKVIKDKTLFDVCTLSIEALEKQIPKKPIESGKYNFNCPCCNTELGIEKEDIYIYQTPAPQYCDECGQALDWS